MSLRATKFSLGKIAPAPDKYTREEEQSFRKVIEAALTGVLPAINDFVVSLSGALDAIAALPTVASGTYTPTLTNTANLDASAAYVCQWLRVGNTVTVSGRVDVNPTSAATLTRLGISLPVSTAFASATQCGGAACAWGSGIEGQSAAIVAIPGSSNVEMLWLNGADTSASGVNFTLTYLIV